MAIFLLGISGCNKAEEEVDSNLIKTVTDAPGTLCYYQEYKMFGIDSLKTADEDKPDSVIIDGGYIYLIKGFKEKLPADTRKKVTFSGKYYPSNIVYPIAGYTVFYITDIIIDYE
jgi:hypothetical protein